MQVLTRFNGSVGVLMTAHEGFRTKKKSQVGSLNLGQYWTWATAHLKNTLGAVSCSHCNNGGDEVKTTDVFYGGPVVISWLTLTFGLRSVDLDLSRRFTFI
jgi:hypothetical protein